VWRVLLNETTPEREKRRISRRYWRGGVLSLTGLAIIAGTIVLVQHVSLKPPLTFASIPPVLTPALTLPDKPSIAVLPFANMSGDPEQEYFSDGITDDLITDLSRLPGLLVIARTSSFTYKGKPAKLQDVSKELAQQGIVIPRRTENLEAYNNLLRGIEYLLSYTKIQETAVGANHLTEDEKGSGPRSHGFAYRREDALCDLEILSAPS
jgi:hypothetical protein